MAIGDYIDWHNEQPKPFIWTATASDILAKVASAHKGLDQRCFVCRTTLCSSGRLQRPSRSGP